MTGGPFWPLAPLLCLLVLATTALPAQYAPPLRGELLVTGTFGELRTDHYHAGLDFRGRTGTPVYAVARGFVSRVKVQAGGFGQAVYVDHPDGFRSVYAHLESFAPELHDTVRAAQYAAESFAVDLAFDSLAFPVAVGQRLGAVGNRGHSFGPHLHFEVREIAGDVPVNPLAFGLAVSDRRAPQLRNLRLYELDGRGRSLREHELALREVRPGDYSAGRDTLRVGTARLGVGLKAYDRQDGLPNWNGIYAAELLADSALVTRFACDRIPFAATEYLNALTDYRDWLANRSWYYKFWAGSREQLFLMEPPPADHGVLTLSPHRPRELRLRARDYAGNASETALTVVYDPDLAPAAPPEPHQYFLPAGEESLIDNGDLRLHLPAGSLYADLYFRYARLPDRSAGRHSDTHQLHDPLTPLHGRARLALRPYARPPDSLLRQFFVGHCAADGHTISHGGAWTADGRLATDIRAFGDYAIFRDTLAPTIAIRSFPTDLRRAAGFSLLVHDDVAGGPLRYRATVDGEWVLLEYDAKNDRLDHTFGGGRIGPGNHRFQLTVTDARGNTATFRRDFRR